MAEFIEILSPSALKDLTTANDEVVKLISNINSAGKAMQSIKTPSGSDSAVKNLSNNLIAQEKNIQKVQQALEKARIEEIKLQQAREKAFDKYDAQLAKEQAKLEASQQLYSKVQAKLNALSNEYRNLAVKKELSGKLTDAEAKRYDYLSSRITKYDTTLKAVDASMGKYQRNVGNYSSAFNPLSNSINQLTREMPAFTYSVQTGFMALSNNIPIFTDAISNAIAQNKALQAEGKPTTSVLSQLAGAFFSWQTLLGVGITLLTVYGKEIGDFFQTIFVGSSKLDTATKSLIAFQNAQAKGLSNARNELQIYKEYLSIAGNKALGYEKQKVAIDKLRSSFGGYLKGLSDEQIMKLKGSKIDKEIQTALGYGEKYKANLTEIQQISEKIEMYKKEVDERVKFNRKLKQAEADRYDSSKSGKEILEAEKLISTLKKQEALRKESIKDEELKKATTSDVMLQLLALEEMYNVALKQSLINKEKSILLEAKDDKDKNNKAKKTKEQLEEEERLRNELIKKLREEYLERTKIDDLKSVELEEGFLARLKQQKKAFEELQSTLSSSNKEYAEYQKLIDGIQQSIDLIEDPSKVITSTGPAEFMKKYKKETKEDLDETKSYWEKHGEEVVDLSQELINTLAEISNQRFENQLNNLEKEKNTALLFAGDSVAAREEIERQAEVRRRAILARQAKAQKEMAIFNIITDTAQAVVASLIRDPSGTLAILIGAIGAANLALVASQQVPAFKDGGIHEGGLMMVNDQKGSKYKEIIETPDGKKRIFNERNKILNAPKGTKIYNATETESILFNNELNGILTNNGISNAPTVIVDGGLRKEDFNNGISKLAKTISEKESFSISRDKRGERVFREKQNKRTELLNVRLKMGKYDV
jgi:hypothetical protein